jgi:hypothetical protein
MNTNQTLIITNRTHQHCSSVIDYYTYKYGVGRENVKKFGKKVNILVKSSF